MANYFQIGLSDWEWFVMEFRISEINLCVLEIFYCNIINRRENDCYIANVRQLSMSQWNWNQLSEAEILI